MISFLQRRQYQLVAGHPVLDLVNTLDWRFRESGAEELLASYDDLLQFATQAELLTEKQVRQILKTTTESAAAEALVDCRRLREVIAEVLYAGVEGRSPGDAQLKALERFFREARGHQHLVWNKSGLRWKWQAHESASELPLWILSLSAAHLMTSEEMDRLGVCENDECRWLFLDTSKNHTRRWCDMKVCGNRMKARRFKAQHRG